MQKNILKDPTIRLEIKTYSEFTQADMASWVSACNTAYKFNYGDKLLLKYSNSRLETYFCLLYHNEELKASYSGFNFNFRGLKGFMSTDTFSLFPRGTTIMGEHLYAFLTESEFDVVCGWPNKHIERLRRKFLGWQYIGRKEIYLTYPKIVNRTTMNLDVGPFPRSQGQFLTRKDFGLFYAIDNRTSISGVKYCGLGISMGCLNKKFFHIRIPKYSKLFGYRPLVDGKSSHIRRKMNELFSIADLSWIDVP